MTPAHLLRVKAVGGIYSPKGQNQNLCVQARERVIGAPNKKELIKKKISSVGQWDWPSYIVVGCKTEGSSWGRTSSCRNAVWGISALGKAVG